VVLVEASDALGGQIWRHLPPERPTAGEGALHHGWSTFARMRAGLDAHPAVEICRESAVWSIDRLDPGVRLNILTGPCDASGRRAWSIDPDALVLATGAHDRTLPFPGWHLPGVVTAGAAQALAKGERVAVGRRVIVGGAGPLLLPVTASLLATGAQVAGVFEAARPQALARGWLARPWELAPSLGKVGELAGYLRDLHRHRVPWRPGWGVVAARGDGRVEEVVVARLDAEWSPIPGSHRVIAADAVCVTHAFTPRLDLAVAAGCDTTPNGFLAVDDSFATTVPGVWAAGELTGIAGCDAALAAGAIAGQAAATGTPPKAGRRVRRRAASSAERIEAAHGIGGHWTDWLTPGTLICRCEDVAYGRLGEVLAAADVRSLRTAKLLTRAGLGACQARCCGETVAGILGEAVSGIVRRPIAQPIRIRDLAATDADGVPNPERRPHELPS
jgi:NADPH-dependent 2,4-dienoyl-CoA reductase/sulfur reductase-like enzyme